MSRIFNERDVRRHFDLLQHEGEVGLAQLVAREGEDVIGMGLFDNEADFLSECRRYSEVGILYVGVNPRSVRLLDEYAGLKNRLRTLFTDIVTPDDIDYVTGLAVPPDLALSEAALEYIQDVTILDGGEHFFPLDEPLFLKDSEMDDPQADLSRWFFKDPPPEYPFLDQYTQVMGTALVQPTWRRRRARFRKYRPYVLEGITAKILNRDGSRRN